MHSFSLMAFLSGMGDFSPGHQSSYSAARENGNHRNSAANQEVRGENCRAGKEAPLDHHRITVKSTEMIPRIPPRQSIGIKSDLVHPGFMLPSRASRRISESCLRA